MTDTLQQRSAWYHNRYYLLALGVIFIDQLVKLIVRFTIEPFHSVKVFGDWFKIEHIYNEGAAWGITLQDVGGVFGMELSPETSKRILTLFSIFAVIVIIYFLKVTSKQKSPLPFFVALILGGAMGNIIDRVFYGVWFEFQPNFPQCRGLMHGCVVDMFNFDLWRGKIFGFDVSLWPVFNIADAAILTGILTIIVFLKRFGKIHERRTAVAQPVQTDEVKNDTSTELSNQEMPSETPEEKNEIS